MDDALYHGCEPEVVMEENGDDVYANLPCVSSNFTPINHQLTQLLTPQLSAAASAQQDQNKRSAFLDQRRRHNPVVARYLGLGSTTEPAHLERYAPLPAQSVGPPAKPVRKRRRLGRDTLNPRLVSEGLHIQKAPGTSATSQPRSGACYVQQSKATGYIDGHTPGTDDNIFIKSLLVHSKHVSLDSRIEYPATGYAHKASRNPADLSPTGDFHLTLTDVRHDGECVAFEDGSSSSHHQNSKDKHASDDNFDFDITDDELLTLASEIDGSIRDASRDFSSSLKTPHCKDGDERHHIRETPGIELEEVTTMSSSPPSSKKFISPVTLMTQLLAAIGDEGSTKARKPIVRSPFPGTVRDRSPIVGLSSNTVLRTCFRIGEAINQSGQAAKSGKHMIIELYARVLASERTDTGQHFTFCDIFHAKPPYIKGMYDAAIWKAVPLFEYDSRRLLQQGRMCRCIGKMKREGKERVMTIHNIWEATWEDVEWIEGIVGS